MGFDLVFLWQFLFPQWAGVWHSKELVLWLIKSVKFSLASPRIISTSVSSVSLCLPACFLKMIMPWRMLCMKILCSSLFLLCYPTGFLAARNNREIWEIQKIISVNLPCSTAQIGFLLEDGINIAGQCLAFPSLSEAVLGKTMWF